MNGINYEQMFSMVEFLNGQTMVYCVNLHTGEKTWVGVQFAEKSKAWEQLYYKFKDPDKGFQKPKVSEKDIQKLEEAVKALLKATDKVRDTANKQEDSNDEPR